jgi:hypothetical protein
MPRDPVRVYKKNFLQVGLVLLQDDCCTKLGFNSEYIKKKKIV